MMLTTRESGLPTGIDIKNKLGVVDLPVHAGWCKVVVLENDYAYVIPITQTVKHVADLMSRHESLVPKIYGRTDTYLRVQRIHYTNTLSSLLSDEPVYSPEDEVIVKQNKLIADMERIDFDLYFRVAEKNKEIDDKHNAITLGRFVGEIIKTDLNLKKAIYRDIHPYNVIYDTKTERWYLVDV